MNIQTDEVKSNAINKEDKKHVKALERYKSVEVFLLDKNDSIRRDNPKTLYTQPNRPAMGASKCLTLN